MTRYVGGQSQVFMGVVQDVARARPPVWKCIDPDSSIFAAIKQASPGTATIARIYTGAPVVDDESKYTAAYIYGRNYADLVYSRVLDPAHTDYIESENEPNDHYGDLTRFIQRLNAFLVGFGERAKQLGFRPIGPNFSVGYPEVYVPGTDYELWPNAWAGLADGLRAIKSAGGALGLHEYSAPDMFNGWSDAKQLGYLTGRHKAIYRCLPADLQDMPLYLTEYGIDWLISPYNQQGGFWHNRDENAPAWYVDQLRQAWDRIYKTTPQLRGACHFIHGNNNAALWEEYDTTRTDTARQIFVDFMREELPAQVVPPVAPPTGGGMARTAQDRLNVAWRAVGIVYNPDAAFPKEAQRLGLGRPVTNEYRDMTTRPTIAGQGFNNAFLECAEGDWSHMVAYDWLTGEAYSAPVPPAPQPGTLPPYVFPPILTAAGFIGIEGHPAAGHTFYRVAPQATVRLGVSAFCDVTVLGPGGAPAIGVQVVSLRADGKGEILSTDGSGKVRFYFGAGSAFTPPARPPFEVFMAEGAVKDDDTKLISVALQVSDSVCVGDTRGEHTETYLQFIGYAM